jgi:hypothetical protein
VRADRRARTLGFGAAALLLGLGARSAPAPDLAGALRQCAAQTDTAQRLSCYDRLAAALGASSPAVAAAPAAAAEARDSAAARLAPQPSSALTAPAPLTPAGSRGPSAPAPAAASLAPAGDAGAGSSEFGVANGPLQARKATGRVKSITATVAAVTVKANGRLAMRLDNGQVWLQLQTVEYFSPRPGDKVEVSEGALGSYVLWIPSARRASKVSRIE